MPTLPSEATGPPPGEPHRARAVAESFGTDPARYDRARPGYPDAMVGRIVDSIPGPDVLDVGCGTGIVARRFQTVGCRVLGVDVDPRMAAFAQGRGIEVEVAAFEDWDPAGRTFDAVVAGQTWHWVEPVAGAAKAAAVLRPGGRLAVFWNAGQAPAELANAFADVYRRVAPESIGGRWWTGSASAVEGYSRIGAKAADALCDVGSFAVPEEWRFDWEQTYTRDEWVDQVPTTGGHDQLAPAQLDELLGALGAAVDAMGGCFTMQYTTLVITAVRTAAAAA